MGDREFLSRGEWAFAGASWKRAERPTGAISKACVPRERDDSGCPARKRRTGVRTIRSGSQTRLTGVYLGIEDQVTKDQQEALQICKFFSRSDLNTFLSESQSTVPKFRKCCENSQPGCSSSYLFSTT